jgi:hypothetical protein
VESFRTRAEVALAKIPLNRGCGIWIEFENPTVYGEMTDSLSRQRKQKTTQLSVLVEFSLEFFNLIHPNYKLQRGRERSTSRDDRRYPCAQKGTHSLGKQKARLT